MRLGPRQLAGVDVSVDQVKDSVTLEHATVVVPGPDGVGQNPDADSPPAQPFPQRSHLLVGERVRLPELPVCRQGRLAPKVAVIETRLGEDLVQAGTAVVGPAAPPRRILSGQDARGQRERLLLLGMHLTGEHPPLLLKVERMPRREGAAPVEDHRTATRHDGVHQLAAPRTSDTTSSTIWPSGTSRRSPVARSLISIVPACRPLPTMTMVGTPISSASLNFTPGETFRRSS